MRLFTYLTPGFPASLFESLAAAIDAELVIVTGSSGPSASTDPFRDGEADLGWVCSTSFHDLIHRPEGRAVQIAGLAWVPIDPDAAGRPVYFSDVVAGAALTDATSLEDLRGLRVGFNDHVSLSGHLALKAELRSLGHDLETFVDLVPTGGHQRSLDLLAAGQLDAAAIDSIVRLSRANTDPETAALRVIERLGPFPTQPLVARADLDPDVLGDVQRRLLATNDDPAMQAEFAKASIDRLVPVGPDHCAPSEAAYRASLPNEC